MSKRCLINFAYNRLQFNGISGLSEMKRPYDEDKETSLNQSHPMVIKPRANEEQIRNGITELF